MNVYDGFDCRGSDRHASESVFLLANYIWSSGDDTPYAISAGSVSSSKTKEIRDKIADTNASEAIVSIVRHFLLQGVAFFAIRKDGVSIFSPMSCSYERNDCGDIEAVTFKDCVEAADLIKMADEEIFPGAADRIRTGYSDPYSKKFLGKSNANIIRTVTSNPLIVSDLISNHPFEGEKILNMRGKWFIIVSWQGVPISFKSVSERPVDWVEYPLKTLDGEPLSVGEEASVLAKRYEHAKYLLHEAAHMTARPPLLFINDSMTEMGELQICPDGITVMDTGVGSGSATGDIRKLYDLGPPTQILMKYVEFLEARIKEAYGLSGLALPSAGTPEESAALQSARNMRMKIIAETLRKKVLDPIVRKIGDAPKKDWEIGYDSVAENDDKRKTLDKYAAFMSMAGSLAAFDPSAADVADARAVMRGVSELLEIEDNLLRTPEEVDEIGERRRMAELAAREAGG